MKKDQESRVMRHASLIVCLLVGILFATAITGLAAPAQEISGCAAIGAAGRYKLVADLSGSSTCLTIIANDVELSLNGHTISGPGNEVEDWAGILVVGVSNVNIKGPGVVTNFRRGVDFEGVDYSEVKDVTSTGNFFGFTVNADFLHDVGNFSEYNTFKANVSTLNVQHGFSLDRASNNTLKDNQTNDNGANGILVYTGTGNTVKGNTSLGNFDTDLKDETTEGCGNNIWKENIFVTANLPCIH
jgi:parallel beta-helix repeat protein